MRTTPALLTFCGASLAGYTLWNWGYTSLCASGGRLSVVGPIQSDPAPAPVATSDANAPLSVEVLSYGRPDDHAHLAQLRRTLQLLQIDPSWAEALASTDTSGFPDLMRKLQALPSVQRGHLKGFLMERYAIIAPQEGFAYFKTNDPKEMTTFLHHWGAADVEAAYSAATKEKDSKRYISAVLAGKAEADPAGLAAWAQQHPDINPLALINNLDALGKLTTLSPTTIKNWLNDLPEDDWYGCSVDMAKLGRSLMQKDPEGALDWIKAITDQETQTPTLLGAIDALAGSQPQKALELIKAIKDENEGSTALATIASFIKKLGWHDPDTALAVLPSLPNCPPIKRVLIGQLIETLLKTDPQRAFQVAESLSKDMERYTLEYSPDSIEEANQWLDYAKDSGENSFRRGVILAGITEWFQRDALSLANYLKGKMEEPAFSSMRDEIQDELAELTADSPDKSPLN